MKKINFLLLITVITLISSCKFSFTVSETMKIATTKESIDADVKKGRTVIDNVNQQVIKEDIYNKYPDAIKQYVDKIMISIVKEKNKDIASNAETFKLQIKITMNYDKSKSGQAKEIIQFYGKHISEELVNKNIIIEK
jgi:hypothetical protein